jgi:Fe-S cluster assembly scaffold protein SufB
MCKPAVEMGDRNLCELVKDGGSQRKDKTRTRRHHGTRWSFHLVSQVFISLPMDNRNPFGNLDVALCSDGHDRHASFHVASDVACSACLACQKRSGNPNTVQWKTHLLMTIRRRQDRRVRHWHPPAMCKQPVTSVDHQPAVELMSKSLHWTRSPFLSKFLVVILCSKERVRINCGK